MANNDNINVVDLNNILTHRHGDNIILPMTPPAVDPHRPPIYNKENICPCACDCTRVKEIDGGGTEAHYAETAIYDSSNDDYNSYASSAQGDIGGDEGAEDRLIDVSDFGLIPEREIIRALIKHGRLPILPTTSTSPASDFMSPASSMYVEASSGSDDQSMTQSMTSSMMSHLSRGSSMYGYTDEWVHRQFEVAGFTLVYNPLPLTAEMRCQYPMDLSISESEFAEHE